MRPYNLVVAIALLCCALTAPVLEAKTKKTAQHGKSSSSRSHVVRKASSSHSSRYSKTAKAKRGSRYGKARLSGSPRQQMPTTDRYAEIQRALAEKGYYRGEVNGQWGPDSSDALKRFQADHNLTVDGKIGAKSLIELGLGPKRDALIGEVAKPNEQTPQGQQ